MSLLIAALAAWFLVGALPRMSADAGRELPRIHRKTREMMTAHSVAARKDGVRKRAEWYGWTVAASAVGAARVTGYLIGSAWHGWGDHRRRAMAAARAAREKRAAARATEPDAAAAPDGPAAPPDGPGSGDRAEPETVPPAAAAPPEPEEAGADVRPFRRPAAPASRAAALPRGDRMTTPATEAPDLETAVHVTDKLIEAARREHDAAQAELIAAKAVLGGTEAFGATLAAAGIGGPVMEALASYTEAAEGRVRAAEARVAATDAALASATQAREGLRPHEAAADALSATGGAARETAWYGAPAGAGGTAVATARPAERLWDVAENQ